MADFRESAIFSDSIINFNQYRQKSDKIASRTLFH